MMVEQGKYVPQDLNRFILSSASMPLEMMHHLGGDSMTTTDVPTNR